MRDLNGPATAGNMRPGISEDFVPRQLPQLLRRFSRRYPGVSVDLMTAYDENRVDAVIAKKDGRAQRGRVFWREPLVWMASADCHFDFSGPAPLVMLRAPCTYREPMITALDSVD